MTLLRPPDLEKCFERIRDAIAESNYGWAFADLEAIEGYIEQLEAAAKPKSPIAFPQDEYGLKIHLQESKE